jgi:Predicted oxidoreductases (related to aryl-alcohol dehydrogenases)
MLTSSPLQGFYGTPPPEEERLQFLDRAHELGCRHWDTAALYGDSEELLGRWFERTGKRKDVRPKVLSCLG